MRGIPGHADNDVTTARGADNDGAVVEEACHGTDLDGSLRAAWRSMSSVGVHRIRSTDLLIFS